ncbi:MAG: hypothetical protein ACKO96_00730 [Flammeovirgaceae bacterium]
MAPAWQSPLTNLQTLNLFIPYAQVNCVLKSTDTISMQGKSTVELGAAPLVLN